MELLTELIPPLLELIPEVLPPLQHSKAALTIKDRLKWTAAILVIYLIMSQVSFTLSGMRCFLEFSDGSSSKLSNYKNQNSVDI